MGVTVALRGGTVSVAALLRVVDVPVPREVDVLVLRVVDEPVLRVVDVLVLREVDELVLREVDVPVLRVVDALAPAEEPAVTPAALARASRQESAEDLVLPPPVPASAAPQEREPPPVDAPLKKASGAI